MTWIKRTIKALDKLSIRLNDGTERLNRVKYPVIFRATSHPHLAALPCVYCTVACTHLAESPTTLIQNRFCSNKYEDI